MAEIGTLEISLSPALALPLKRQLLQSLVVILAFYVATLVALRRFEMFQLIG